MVVNSPVVSVFVEVIEKVLASVTVTSCQRKLLEPSTNT